MFKQGMTKRLRPLLALAAWTMIPLLAAPLAGCNDSKFVSGSAQQSAQRHKDQALSDQGGTPSEDAASKAPDPAPRGEDQASMAPATATATATSTAAAIGTATATAAATVTAAGTATATAPVTASTGQVACTTGCCPSTKIAFMDCSAAGNVPAPTLVKDKFEITTVQCQDAVTGYDTIIYYGPVPPSSTSKFPLPDTVNTAFANGAKVLVVPTPHSGMTNLYGITLEHNGEYLKTVAESVIMVTNANAMSTAFNKDRYGQSTPALLLQPGSWSSGKLAYGAEADWCTDLVAKKPNSGTLTGFHAYMLDGTGHKGLLVLANLNLPTGSNGGAAFDFSEAFLASHLTQKWNQAGGQRQCDLACAVVPGTSGGYIKAAGIGKPVIYLYPEKEQDITVKLDFDGQLVTTYPQIDRSISGWKVRAKPNGDLIDQRDGQEYSYIYWNGNSNAFRPDFSQGFVVSGAESRKFLQRTLKEIGLNAREANDMIVYWLPYLERNPYNLIHFAQNSYTDIAKLDVSPKPDSVLRVFLQFKRLEQPERIPPQKLRPFVRHGFTVIEWGGTEIDGNWHIIQ